MTQYIGRDDAEPMRRKVERTMRDRAEAAVAATVPMLLGKSEADAQAVLDGMVQGLIREIDELERQVLQDLDAVAIEAD